MLIEPDEANLYFRQPEHLRICAEHWKLWQLVAFVWLLLREEMEHFLMPGDGVPHFVTYSWHDTIYFLFTQKIKLVYLSPCMKRTQDVAWGDISPSQLEPRRARMYHPYRQTPCSIYCLHILWFTKPIVTIIDDCIGALEQTITNF